MSTCHLHSLREEKRRERLEWLGDVVLEEIVVRLIARQVLYALDREEEAGEKDKNLGQEYKESTAAAQGGGVDDEDRRGENGHFSPRVGETEATGGEGRDKQDGFRLPSTLRPLSWRLDFATRLAVSNANLKAVYEAQLGGLMRFLGLEEDPSLLGLSGAGGGDIVGGGKAAGRRGSGSKRRLSSGFSSTSPLSSGDGGADQGSRRKRRRPSSSSRSGGPSFAAASFSSPNPKKRMKRAGRTEKLAKRLSTSQCPSLDANLALPASCSRPRGGSPAYASTPSRMRRFNRMDKRMPDVVEAAIGEAFEASLLLGLSGGDDGGARRKATASSSLDPQRFAGEHRAALVDGLLSSALATDYFLSGLEEPRDGRSRCVFSDNDVELAGDPYAYDDELTSGFGFTNSFGAFNSSSSSDELSDDEKGGQHGGGGHGGGTREDQGTTLHDEDGDADKTTMRAAEVRATVAAEAGLSSPSETAAAAAAAAAAVADGIDNKESIAAGRDAVLRLYGAVLLKFRTSVFLFCSAGELGLPHHRNGGDAHARGDEACSPSDLTLRRQGVMSGENLEAVATHLQSLERDADFGWMSGGGVAKSAAAGESAAAAAAAAAEAAAATTATASGAAARWPRARDWLRAEVGRSVLCRDDGGGSGKWVSKRVREFSTRVAALLLSRSGERGGPPRGSTPDSVESSKAQGMKAAGQKPGCEEPKLAPAGVSTRMALAELQFARDPWPAEDLPRAREQTARMFLPRTHADRNENCNRNEIIHKSRSTPCGIAAAAGGGGGPVANTARCGVCCECADCLGNSDDVQCSRPLQSLRPMPASLSTEVAARTPKTRRAHRDSGKPLCIPPHYAGLLGRLPRDTRQLLARLGHQGYVKVLEELLDGFLRASNGMSTEAAVRGRVAATPAAVPAGSAAAAAATPAAVPVRADATEAAFGVVPSPAAAAAAAAAAAISSPSHPDDYMDDKNGDEPKPCLGSTHPDRDHHKNPWQALQTGAPHPSLCGLVEPCELASAGPERMVLPMPSPFYRRVLHALCRVHGLTSRGGETGRQVTEAGGEAAVRFRTVEITRGGGRGRGSGESSWLGGTLRGVKGGVIDGMPLIPVETLLGEKSQC